MRNSIVYSATLVGDGRQYIGCTKQTLIKRKHLHADEAARGKSGKFMDAIREFGIDGFDWKIECEFEDHSSALSYEGVLVEDRNTRRDGFNTYRGGGRNGGRTRTDEECAALRERALRWQAARKDYGSEIGDKLRRFYRTDEGVRQLATRKATANRDDVRKRMSESHGGRPVQVFKDGALVATYLTQGECSRALGVSQGNLNSCLLRRPGCKSLRGFTFGFAGEGEVIPSDSGREAA